MWFLVVILFLTKFTSAQLNNASLTKFKSFGFGMVSYFDAVTDLQSQTELINFINNHNITFINQYVCSVTSAQDYANFVDNVYNRTGAKINMLFDETLVEHSHNSTCDIDCTPGKTTGAGWCCASVARKFAWMVEVLNISQAPPEAIDGAAFDIEGLQAHDYYDLWTTMRVHWNATVAKVKGKQVLRWYFGSIMGNLAVQAVKEGLIDQLYWENYQNTNKKYVARARRLLDPLSKVYNKSSRVFIHGQPVNLLSEINCCSQPCVYSNACGLCNTYALEQRNIISFCGSNIAPKQSQRPSWFINEKGNEEDGAIEMEKRHRHMDVDYMMQTMETSRFELRQLGYGSMLGPNVLYDFRAIFMKIYGKDTYGNHLCPKVPKK